MPTTCKPGRDATGSVVSQTRSNAAQGRMKRAGVYGRSWLPGTASTGGPSDRRNFAACSSWASRPRCERSPEATTSCGSSRSTSRARLASTSRSSCAPTWRSETWRMRVATVERGYRLDAVAEDSAEIFDDLYLGLRAGGALRKQRRGEELTHEEIEALGRWQRLSTARKAAAIGAFAFGTFGLGFTLGGLVFGRWRKR